MAAPSKDLRLMAFDVDGVLTDGRLYYSDQGVELKAYHAQDGRAMKLLQKAGITLALITGRNTPAVANRARDLGIDIVLQGILDKRTAMGELLAARGLDFSQAGYMGDDVQDIKILAACGFSAAPADAHPLVKAHVAYVSALGGGHGAVREVCEHILAAQGRLDALFASYLP